MQNAIDKLIPLIKREALTKTPFLVAIEGRCASGKTTLAAELARRLGASLIHMDDFFLRPEQRTPARLAIPGENIDHERFLSEVLLPLRAGKPFAYRPFSCRSQTLTAPVTVEPGPIAIVEGVYSCHPDLRKHYDLRLFLTVDPEEQMRRLYARDGDYAEIFRDRWIPLEELYFSSCGVEDCCSTSLFLNEKNLQNRQ